MLISTSPDRTRLDGLKRLLEPAKPWYRILWQRLTKPTMQEQDHVSDACLSRWSSPHNPK